MTVIIMMNTICICLHALDPVLWTPHINRLIKNQYDTGVVAPDFDTYIHRDSRSPMEWSIHIDGVNFPSLLVVTKELCIRSFFHQSPIEAGFINY